MKCEKVRELVSDYVDGLVSPRVREEMTEHFAVCADCAREVETTTRMLAAVSELGKRKAPVDLRPAVQLRIAEMNSRKLGLFGKYLTPVLRPLVALPVAAAVAAAFMVMQTIQEPVHKPQTASSGSAEMAAYVEKYSEFRSKQSFGDTSSLIAAQLERPSKTDR